MIKREIYIPSLDLTFNADDVKIEVGPEECYPMEIELSESFTPYRVNNTRHQAIIRVLDTGASIKLTTPPFGDGVLFEYKEKVEPEIGKFYLVSRRTGGPKGMVFCYMWTDPDPKYPDKKMFRGVGKEDASTVFSIDRMDEYIFHEEYEPEFKEYL